MILTLHHNTKRLAMISVWAIAMQLCVITDAVCMCDEFGNDPYIMESCHCCDVCMNPVCCEAGDRINGIASFSDLIIHQRTISVSNIWEFSTTLAAVPDDTRNQPAFFYAGSVQSDPTDRRQERSVLLI